MFDVLATYRGKKLVGLPALTEAAIEVLTDIRSQRGLDAETNLPSERTVRYYMTLGLLPKADDWQGRLPVYGYRHLLRLVVIKLLQDEKMSIPLIEELIQEKSDQELEEFINDRQQRPMRRSLGQAMARRESPRDRALEYLKSLHFGEEGYRRRSGVGRRERWYRYVVEEGLEIHISEGCLTRRHPGLGREIVDTIAELLDRLP
jgi:DNA-binding transcriptional MerR regulator